MFLQRRTDFSWLQPHHHWFVQNASLLCMNPQDCNRVAGHAELENIRILETSQNYLLPETFSKNLFWKRLPSKKEVRADSALVKKIRLTSHPLQDLLSMHCGGKTNVLQCLGLKKYQQVLKWPFIKKKAFLLFRTNRAVFLTNDLSISKMN